jgi:hypothetical protein
MDVKIAGIYGCLFPQAYGNFIGNLSHVGWREILKDIISLALNPIYPCLIPNHAGRIHMCMSVLHQL